MQRRPKLFSGGLISGASGIIVGVADADVERVEIGEWGREEFSAIIDEALQNLEENAAEAGCEAVTDVRIEVNMYRLLRGLIKIVVIAYGTCVGGEAKDSNKVEMR